MQVQLFEFEADFVNTLRCIPMIVRFKLDLCGIKLSLRAWGRLDMSTRARLVHLPVALPAELEAYRRFLVEAIERTREAVILIAIDQSPA